jgi:hypothetical protein
MNILICTHLWLSQKLFCHKGLILCKAIPSIACIMCPMRIGVIKTRCCLGSHLRSTRTARTRVALGFFLRFVFLFFTAVCIREASPFVIHSISLSLCSTTPLNAYSSARWRRCPSIRRPSAPACSARPLPLLRWWLQWWARQQQVPRRGAVGGGHR